MRDALAGGGPEQIQASSLVEESLKWTDLLVNAKNPIVAAILILCVAFCIYALIQRRKK